MAILVALLLAIFVLPSPWGAVAVAGAVVFDTAESLVLIHWSKRRRAAVGAEALIGKHAIAVDALTPEGQVKLDGELWRARCTGYAAPGTPLVVTGIDGLTLEVEPA
jgi:membrane protein implicated in regulation of membrane protease activity